MSPRDGDGRRTLGLVMGKVRADPVEMTQEAGTINGLLIKISRSEQPKEEKARILVSELDKRFDISIREADIIRGVFLAFIKNVDLKTLAARIAFIAEVAARLRTDNT